MYRIALTFLFCLTLPACASFMGAVTTGDMEDDPGDRSLGEQVIDEEIETMALVNIRKADPALENANIDVVSYFGYVLIVGQVASENLKSVASDELRSFRNVKRIYNELEIAGPTSTMTRSSDTWLTTKVKSTFLGRTDIQGGRIKVVTENGVVYLMGLVTRDEADRAAAIAAEVTGVQKVVQVFSIFEG